MIECSICKTNNEDRSLYCLECGQRLKPKGSNSDLATADVLPTYKQEANQSSSKLHSPMLDIAEQSGGRKNKGGNNQFNTAENISNETNSRPMGISRNGLHSPLLDRRNYFPNPYPETNSTAESYSEPNSRHSDKSRLHSPTLDGQGSGSTPNNTAHSKNNFVVEEEYESLRSPLLKSKVPLPEAHLPEIQTPGTTSIKSILSSASSPSPNSVSENSAARGAEQILSFTGINKSAANKDSVSNKRPALNMSQSLLPADMENPDGISPSFTANKPSFNKTILAPLVFLSLGFKIWFLVSLGNTLFSSPPFAFDQVGQILALILILVLLLSNKN